MASEHIRNFIMGSTKHIWTEGLDAIQNSIELKGNPANIATDIRLLNELIRGYRWAIQRGYNGE